jgi:hypothetical protein
MKNPDAARQGRYPCPHLQDDQEQKGSEQRHLDVKSPEGQIIRQAGDYPDAC